MKDNVEFVLKLVTFIAIPVTLYFTWLAHQQRAMFDMIDKMYSVCNLLHDQVARNWHISHMFCIGDDLYWDVRHRVKLEVEDGVRQPIERAQMIEDERNFAVRIFICYEQVYYQQKQCGRLHAERGRFLSAMLNYFSDRLVQNPRLLAYLAASRDGCQLHLERESTKDLLKRLGGEESWLARADFEGPFNRDPRVLTGRMIEECRR